MLKRKVYESLVKWKSDKRKLPLLINGPRQVGKTFIVDYFGKRNYKNYIRIDFEREEDLRFAFEGNLDVDVINEKISARRPGYEFTPRETLIFFDGIQACPKARTSLKSFGMDGRFDVIASGSLLGMTYGQKSQVPVGYERHLDMHPLDFEEFLWAFGHGEGFVDRIKSAIKERKEIGEPFLDVARKSFRDYMAIGGMPRVVSGFVGDRHYGHAMEELGSILRSSEADIAKYNSGPDGAKTLACLRSVPGQLSKTNKKFVYADVDRESWGSARKYEGNLLWLKDAGLIAYCHNLTEPRPPLSARGILDSFKVYTRDTGLLTTMYGPSAMTAVVTGDKRVNRGAIVENAVAGSLYKGGGSI